MMNFQGEINDTRRLIWQVRSYIGRDLFDKAEEDIRYATVALDMLARVSNHIPTEQLIELKELGEQACDILMFLNNR